MEEIGEHVLPFKTEEDFKETVDVFYLRDFIPNEREVVLAQRGPP